MLSQKLKLIHHASIHPVHFGEFSFSSSYGQISRNHSFCRCGCLPWTWLGRILNFIGTWILNPLKTGGGQPMAFGGFGICLGGYFLCWILIIDPMNCWALQYQWRPASGIWTIRKPQPTQSHKPAQFKQTCLESCTKGLCFWTRKHEQQNSIDHFCLWIWRLWESILPEVCLEYVVYCLVKELSQ